MPFTNTSDIIGKLLIHGSTNVTGSIENTLYFILLFIVAVALYFGIPLEFLIIIIFPYCLVCAAYFGFTIPIIIIIVYIAAIIAKNFLIR